LDIWKAEKTLRKRCKAGEKGYLFVELIKVILSLVLSLDKERVLLDLVGGRHGGGRRRTAWRCLS